LCDEAFFTRQTGQYGDGMVREAANAGKKLPSRQ
jgi:hypothetical protein